MADVKLDGMSELLAKLELLRDYAERAIEKGIEKAAAELKEDVKSLAPVDTGRLRESIKHTVKKGAGRVEAAVSTDVEYASNVEFGTRNPPQPFLFPAFVQNQGRISKEITNEVKKAVREVGSK